ncbi:hypothetical protein EV126DRAFT_187831 [Verticillium dahliae]|nr:hypothetical protein EV126DRAFT_187831 [Verticillium dahliae]
MLATRTSDVNSSCGLDNAARTDSNRESAPTGVASAMCTVGSAVMTLGYALQIRCNRTGSVLFKARRVNALRQLCRGLPRSYPMDVTHFSRLCQRRSHQPRSRRVAFVGSCHVPCSAQTWAASGASCASNSIHRQLHAKSYYYPQARRPEKDKSGLHQIRPTFRANMIPR